MTVENNVIPNEFGRNEHVLLLKFSQDLFIDKSLVKAALKDCEFKLQTIKCLELNSNEFKDVDKYRFVCITSA